MGYTVIAVVVTSALLWYRSVNDHVNSQGNRKPSVLADDVYEVLVNIAEGKTQPPVKERTRAMRAAAVRYWRAKGRILVKKDNGKKVLSLF